MRDILNKLFSRNPYKTQIFPDPGQINTPPINRPPPINRQYHTTKPPPTYKQMPTIKLPPTNRPPAINPDYVPPTAINPYYVPPPSIYPIVEPKPKIEINDEYITVKIQEKEYKEKINLENIFKKKLNKTCFNGTFLTNNDVKIFLFYIKSFIDTFINDPDIFSYFNDNNIFLDLFKSINKFYNNIILNLLEILISRQDSLEYKYRDHDIPNYLITSLVSEINNNILILKRLSNDYTSKNETSTYYIHHICIILRRILIDLSNIIKGNKITLEYIPIDYMRLFIYKIHFRNNCLGKKVGGINKSNYKKTENKITVIYKKKKYTRVIYINERKKYVKIDKTFMLLSKLKKDIKI
jgi:hypothetical protein